MRKYLTNLIFFLVLASVVYTGVIVVAGSVAPMTRYRNIKLAPRSHGHLFTRIREIPAHAEVDILFAGSSHAYRGFDPRVFARHGLTTFNLGSSSQTPLQTQLLADRYLDHLSPRLVVMEVFPLTFNDAGVEAALDWVANDTMGWDMVGMALQLRNIALVNTMIHSGYRQLMGMDKGATEPLVRDNDRYISGGYVEKGSVRYDPDHTRALLEWSPPPHQLEAFERLVKDLEARNIPLVLVQTPVTSAFRYNVAERKELRSFFEAYAPYVDLSDLYSGPDSVHFYDGHHMRQPAVEAFNAALIDTLQLRNLLPLAVRP